MNIYKLSNAAVEDINGIYDFGEYQFGVSQAIKYILELEDILEKLAENPYLGRKRMDLDKYVYSFPFVSHIIFYKISENGIFVGRILHGNKDYQKSFKFFE